MRTLMTIQAGHQRSALHFLGLDPQSQVRGSINKKQLVLVHFHMVNKNDSP